MLSLDEKRNISNTVGEFLGFLRCNEYYICRYSARPGSKHLYLDHLATDESYIEDFIKQIEQHHDGKTQKPDNTDYDFENEYNPA